MCSCITKLFGWLHFGSPLPGSGQAEARRAEIAQPLEGDVRRAATLTQTLAPAITEQRDGRRAEIVLVIREIFSAQYVYTT